MNLLKSKAIVLRKKGYSYALIKERLGVSKSTLSNWLSEIPFIPNKEVLARIGDASLKMVRTKQKEKFRVWDMIKKDARKEIGEITKRDLFMLGLGLYIGEGAKTFDHITVANSDPAVIRLAVTWFVKICRIPRQNFTLIVHLYPDNNIKESLEFWSAQTGIPIKNFNKTSIDRRANKSQVKRRKLPYGTAHLRIRASGNPQFGVQLFRRILAWIENATNQVE